ncbi:MAG: ankyrin repeat domain-containing protein [Gammaproteobacteria bacterium]|nr:ankyrin repeat domain-containing protein [Gammaproteobacteria bacterium]
MKQDEAYRLLLFQEINSPMPNFLKIENTRQEWAQHRIKAVAIERDNRERYAKLDTFFKHFLQEHEESKNEVALRIMITQKKHKDAIKHGTQELFEVLHNKDVNYAETLLKARIDINSYNNEGTTPLLQAIQKDCTEQVKWLLERKADPNKKVRSDIAIKPNRGMPPLLATVIWTYNNTAILQLLLQHKADINLSNDSQVTALHGAMLTLSTDHAKYLLNQNASIDLLDSFQRSPLSILESRKKNNFFAYKTIKLTLDQTEQKTHSINKPGR